MTKDIFRSNLGMQQKLLVAVYYFAIYLCKIIALFNYSVVFLFLNIATERCVVTLTPINTDRFSRDGSMSRGVSGKDICLITF